MVGEHTGLMYYTLGQRRGLGIGGLKAHSEDPWFVATKDLERNVLVVVQGEHPLLYSDTAYCEPAAWIAGTPPEAARLRAKTRYRQQDEPCQVQVLDDGGLAVHFDTPQRAVTPGQSLVLYADDVCLGGAVIRATATTATGAAEPTSLIGSARSA